MYQDRLLVEQKHPTCTAEEIPSYVWAKKKASDGTVNEKDEPLKELDDGVDTMRYVVMEVDTRGKAGVRFLQYVVSAYQARFPHWQWDVIRKVTEFLTKKTNGALSVAGLASFSVAAFLTDIRLGAAILGLGLIILDFMRESK